MRPGPRRRDTATDRSPTRPLAALLVLMLALPSVATVASQWDVPSDDGTRASASPDEWLTFKGDDQRTGVSASEAPSVGKVLWERQYKGSVIYSSPTVWNDTVFIGVSGSIKAIWAKNGTERWTYIAPNPVYTSPVISGGVIYAGANDFSGTSAVAVNVRTGEEVWNSSVPDFVTSTPLVLGPSVFVGCQNGILYCLKRSDGSQRWNFSAGGDILFGSIAELDGLIYFGIKADSDNNGRLFAVDSDTGQEAWNRSVVGSIWSSPSVSEGTVLVGTAGDQSLSNEVRNGFVYAFNATTGQQAWRSRNLGMVYASPSVKDGRIYIGTFGKVIQDIQFIAPQMYCLGLANGNIIWNRTVSHQSANAKVWSSVTIAGAKIIFGDELGYLNVWNKHGVRIWDYAIHQGAAIKVSPAVAIEMVFAATTLGEVVGFGSQPDLTVNATSIQVSDEYPHLGQRVDVWARISNIGDKTASGRVFLYNGSLDDWHTVINKTSVRLAPGGSTLVHAVWTADEVGTRATWVRITDVVPNEADETNNEAKRVIEVLPPARGWLSGRADRSGIGFMATEPPSNNITKWLRAEGASPGPGLAATMETVYFPVGRRLVALDRLEGTVSWSFDLNATPTTPPGVGDGAVFVGTASGQLQARDLEDGEVRFVRSLDGPVTAGPVVLGSLVLAGTTVAGGGGTLWALDTFDGSRVWSRDMGGGVKAPPASADNTTYAVSDDGAIQGLNVSDGKLRWQFPIGSAPDSSLTSAPMVDGEYVYVASTSGFVYCLDADPSDGVDEGKDDPDGSGYDVIWTYKQEDLLPFNRSPVLVDGRLVLLVGEAGVLALNATNGSLSWRADVEVVAPVTMDLAAVNGSLVVGGAGIRIITSDAGVTTWSYSGTTAPMVNGPAALDGMLFTADDRGILFAFGLVENQPPVARISAPPSESTFRINETITFDGSTSSDDKELPETSFHWDFGDGNSSIASVTSHRYEREGYYTVVLSVTDTDGMGDNTSIKVHILGNHPPVLDWWNVDPDQGKALLDRFNFSVRYTDPDNDPPQFVQLQLADEPGYPAYDMQEEDPDDDDLTDGKMYYYMASLGSRPYPNVTFQASDGIATSRLVVQGPVVTMEGLFSNSVGDIEVDAEYVGPNDVQFLPVVSPPLNYPPGQHPIGVFVELDLDTIFLKSARLHINFTFRDVEDMNLSTLAIYRWTVSGSISGWEYIVGSVVDEEGRSVRAPIPSMQNDIYTVLGEKLNPPENRPPVAVIMVDGETYSPGATVKRTYEPGEVIDFDGTGSYDPDKETTHDDVVFWGWSFGDGTSAEGKLATHGYEVPNKYTVTLTVRDSFGAEGKVTVVINVRTEGENTLLYFLVIVGIVIILILLFFPKGAGTKAPPAKPEPKEAPSEGKEEPGPPLDEDEGPEPDQTELDDIIDELEEDRSKKSPPR